MRGAQAQVGPVHRSEDKDPRGVCPAFLLHICCWAHVSLSPIFGFLRLCSKYLLEPIVPCVFRLYKMLRSKSSKATYTGLFKSCVWEHFPEWAGASRSLFSSKFSRREVCNVSFGFLFDIFIWNAKMPYHSLWMGKTQNCVSLLSVWFLKKCVFKICVLSGFLFCITALVMWLSWLSVHRILSSLKCGAEQLWVYSKIFVPWAQYCIINIFNGMDFIPSVYVCKY